MKYFYIYQDGLNDTNPELIGTFSSIEKVKEDVEKQLDRTDFENGLYISILQRDKNGSFKQVLKGFCLPNPEIKWTE
jgi:hypothetical protein